MDFVEVPGRKIASTPAVFSVWMSCSGMMPPAKTRMSSAPCSLSSRVISGSSALWAPDRIESPHGVHVLLNGGGGDLLGSLPQARVDHLVARVAQCPRHDLRAPVVPIQAGLGDQDATSSVIHGGRL